MSKLSCPPRTCDICGGHGVTLGITCVRCYSSVINEIYGKFDKKEYKHIYDTYCVIRDMGMPELAEKFLIDQVR